MVKRRVLKLMHDGDGDVAVSNPGNGTEGLSNSLSSAHADAQPDGAFAEALSNARSAWMAAMSAHFNRLGVVEFPQQPYLAPHHLQNCVVVPYRDDIFERMPSRGRVAELGVQTGELSRYILETCTPAELHLIDVDLTAWNVAEKFADEIAQGGVTLHEADSADTIAAFPDGYFDFIYIDADHSYEGVTRDIAAAKTKVAPDGFLLFNDYTFWSPTECMPYGVVRAVNELCLDDDWEFAYLALGNFGYMDVALRRRKKRSLLSVLRALVGR